MKKIIFSLILFLFISCGGTTWPKVGDTYEVSYKIEDGFSISEVEKIQGHMKEWEECGNLEFVEVDDIEEQDTYLIQKGIVDEDDPAPAAGTSTVGYDENGENWLILYQVTTRAVLHELGHCLGLLHEHQRYDRWMYVEVDFGNIYFDKWHNFIMRNNLLYLEYEYEYDYYSVMHYGGFAFNKDERIPSIIPIDQSILPEDLGSNSITELDCEKIGIIYE